jgi:LacI family transcriptional regulator
MVKLSEIAEESGFSIPVVSRVLSPKPHKDARVAENTRKHIREVAKRMGYRPNRNAEFLKRGQNPVIGCFLPSRTDSLLAKLMKGIAEEAEKNNFPLAFYFDMTKKSYLEFIERSRQSKNCGIITYPYFKMDPEVEDVISDYQANGGKIVLIEGGSSRWQWHNCTSVSIDNYHGGKLAAEHLIKKDVKLFITQKYDNIPERTFGFTDTIKKAGQELCVINLLEDIIDRVKKTGSYPVGIFLPRDQDAVTLLCKLQQNSINVGKDVLLIGYGDLYLVQNLSPALTTVMQPFAEIGKIALQKLVADIYGKTIESTLIKPKLITRRST